MKIEINQHFAAVFLVASLVVSTSTAENPTYGIYFPKNLRANFPIQLVAEIFQNPNPVTFTASLTTTGQEVNFLLTALLSEGDAQLLTFEEMIPYSYDGPDEFTMMVEGFDTVTNEKLFENSTTELKFNSKALSIFIQSDKAIYQPSQTVKFRAVVTTAELLPYSGTVTYKLTDPDSNIIVLEKDAQLVNGVVGSEFTLGRYSTQGEWKITYEVLGYKESLIVTVEEYKLPKFEIELSLDKLYIYAGLTHLSGKVSAKFTFGQPVKGDARLRFEMEPPWKCMFGECSYIKINPIEELHPFNGELTFSVPISTLKDRFEYEDGQFYRRFTVTAFVKDKNSLVELNDTAVASIIQHNLKSEVVQGPGTIKPGLPYKAYVRLTQYDGTPLSKITRTSLNVSIQIQYSYPYNYETQFYTEPTTELQKVSVQEDGMIELSIIAKTDNFQSASFAVKIKGYGEYSYFGNWRADRFNSPSNTFIQISSEKVEYKALETAILTIRTTKKAEAYNFLVISRGIVVERITYSPDSYIEETSSFSFSYEFEVERNMFPSVSVFVSFMESGGEIVASSISFDVKVSLLNQVSIKTSTSESDTGLPVKITVSTSPNSYIGLRAIDRSVLLLKEGNDITMDKIFADLQQYGTSYNNYPSFYHYSSGQQNAKDVFQDAGLLVFTDAAIFLSQKSKMPYYYREYEYYDIGYAEAAEMVPLAGEVMFDEGTSEKAPPVQQSLPAPKVRKEFPETWIWEESNSGESGSKTFSYVLPDTTTTWEISSFAVSDVTGLGVTLQNSQIVASRNFFISLDLPATMVNGETLPMRTTVYNYFSEDLEVMLKLEETEWYKFIMIGNDTEVAGMVRRIVVPSQDGVTVVFPIKFVKSGVARIKVTALSEMAGDAIEKTIPVKPEGVAVEKSISTLIERNSRTDEETRVELPVNLPYDIVDGSVYVKLSASGDIMGNALNNIGSLLRIPSGCGEQTMINFAPDVYISLYLQKVDLLTGALLEKSKRHIRAGYQNELRYQHEDGSFSAFGKHDKEGSTWLTSFVIKCFIAATHLDDGLVSKDKVDAGVNFLLGKQEKDGSFVEKGTVSHKPMQGGVNSKETITAYTLVALAESGYHKEKSDVATVIENAKNFLEVKVGDITDTFSLAIVAYALVLSESDKVVEVMDRLEKKAVIDGNLKYWIDDQSAKLQCSQFDWECNSKATSSDIEVTSYILLSLLKMDSEAYHMPIVRWLIEQRSAFGGYGSTQDTVMAIQALATFAGLFSATEKDLTLDISHSENGDFNSQLQINEDNSIVLQSVELPSTSGNVTLAAFGIGIADVQLAIIYHLPPGARADEPFKITKNIKERNDGDNIDITVCTEINENSNNVIESTGMFIITIELPSGYSVNSEEASAQNTNANLVEFVENELTGYFDSLVRGDEICMTTTFARYAKISGLKERSIRVLDYYAPGTISRRMYSPTNDRSDGVCEVCPECEGCLTSDAMRKTVSLLSIMTSFVAMAIFLQF